MPINLENLTETEQVAARNGLGLGSAAIMEGANFATAAQGVKADNALKDLADIADAFSSGTSPEKLAFSALICQDAVYNVTAYGAKGDGITDDTDAINAAIAALTAAGGGVLTFSKGRFLTRGGHVLTVPCSVRGAGYGTIPTGSNGVSILSLRASSNADVLTLAAKNITLSDLGIYGNRGGQTAGGVGIRLSATIASNYFRMQRLWINATFGSGILLAGPGESLEGFISHCRLDACGGYGLDVQAGAADCQATDTVSCNNALGGVSVNAGSFVLSTCHIWGNLGPGIFMPSGAAGSLRVCGSYIETNTTYGIQLRGSNNIVANNKIWKNGGRGVYAFGCLAPLVQGNQVTENNTSGPGATGGAGAGVNFDNVTGGIVSGNFFAGQGQPQKYGYAETGNTCTQCIFIGNVSRASDHGTSSHLVGTGNPIPTIVANNVF